MFEKAIKVWEKLGYTCRKERSLFYIAHPLDTNWEYNTSKEGAWLRFLQTHGQPDKEVLVAWREVVPKLKDNKKLTPLFEQAYKEKWSDQKIAESFCDLFLEQE